MQPLPPIPVEPLPEEYSDREKQEAADFEWAVTDPDVARDYAERYVAVHQRKVWGAGKSMGDAIRAAVAVEGCPGRQWLAVPFIGCGVTVREHTPEELEDEQFEPLPPFDFDEPLTDEYSERELHVLADFEWAVTDPDVARDYAERYVAVHQRKVWGAGKSMGDAIRAAIAVEGCPGRQWLAVPFIGCGVTVREHTPEELEDEQFEPLPPFVFDEPLTEALSNGSPRQRSRDEP